MIELSFTKFINLIKSYNIDTDFRISYETTFKNTIGVKWVTGGRSGGNCWNASKDDNDRYYTREGEREPDFSSLDLIIEKICPEINFLSYKKLCRELLICNNDVEEEYYGNYINYSYKYIDLQKLYDWLGENALIKIIAEPIQLITDENVVKKKSVKKNRQKKKIAKGYKK